MDENKIIKNEDPKMGPLDGVQLRTDCVRTKFTTKVQKNGCKFKMNNTEANVSASIETGTFSIRDIHANTMLAIRIDDAMAICAAAADASRRENNQEDTEVEE